ncbi:hypothetical protein DFS34DRAFT_592896 [Phlyctochytrium arcticum]|nr:hypothetical protein DFS34DRAFT_592896 [Phlyctochytrium arcticum]
MWKEASSKFFVLGDEAADPSSWLKCITDEIGLQEVKATPADIWWNRCTTKAVEWKEDGSISQVEKFARIEMIKHFSGAITEAFSTTYRDLKFDSRLEVRSRELALVGVDLATQEAKLREQERKRKVPEADPKNNCFLVELEKEDGLDPSQWMARYRLVFLVTNAYPFLGKAGFVPADSPFRREHEARLSLEKMAEGEWRQSDAAAIWGEIFVAPLADRDSSSSDSDDFSIYRRPGSPLPQPEQLAKDVVGESLVKAVPGILMSIPRPLNILAIDGTAEFEYRSNFIDRLFQRTMAAPWLDWTTGELQNEIVVRERSSAVASPKHDGLGSIAVGSEVRLDVVFLEVVGGVGALDKAKHRSDTKNVCKAMSLAVHVQAKMVESCNYAPAKEKVALSRISAFGLVVAGRSLHIYGAKWVQQQVAIDQIAKATIPSRMEDWALLGELVKECLLLRECCGLSVGGMCRLPLLLSAKVTDLPPNLFLVSFLVHIFPLHFYCKYLRIRVLLS